MSLSRPSNAYDALAPSESFFEREKARLIEEISTVRSLLVFLLQNMILTQCKELRRVHGQHEYTKSNFRASLRSGKRIYNGCVFMGCKSVGKITGNILMLWQRFNTLIKEQQVSQSNTSPSMLIEYRRSSRLQQMWASLVQEVQTSLRAQARLLLDDPVVRLYYSVVCITTLCFAGCLRLTEQRDFVRLVRAVEMEMSILDDCPSQLMLCFDGASILSVPVITHEF